MPGKDIKVLQLSQSWLNVQCFPVDFIARTNNIDHLSLSVLWGLHLKMSIAVATILWNKMLCFLYISISLHFLFLMPQSLLNIFQNTSASEREYMVCTRVRGGFKFYWDSGSFLCFAEKWRTLKGIIESSQAFNITPVITQSYRQSVMIE